MPFGKEPHEEKDSAAKSGRLRDMALSVAAADLQLSPAPALPNVWGVLMDLGYPQATATLAVFADGTTSLYISSGGGVIGAGEHPPVREEAEKFLSVVESHIADFEPADETPYPRPGRVRFYVRTYKGTLTAEADEKDLGERRHKLAPVFHAGHAVITQMRLISQRREES